MVDVVWVNYARGRLVAFGWIARKCFFRLGRLRVGGWFRLGGLRVDGYHRSCTILPVCLYAFSFFMLFISVAFIFSMDSDEGIQKNGIFVPSL